MDKLSAGAPSLLLLRALYVMKGKRFLAVLIAAFVSQASFAASSVFIFDKEFPLPEGCVLFPRPSLIDEDIRFSCEVDSLQPQLSIRFERAATCKKPINLPHNLISQYAMGELSGSFVTINPESSISKLYVAKIFDEETCMQVFGGNQQAVLEAISPLLNE